MTKWQPIETAPMDGTEILCFIPEHTWSVLRIGDDYKLLSFIQGVGWIDRARNNECPSHWMPNPKPPKTKEKKQ